MLTTDDMIQELRRELTGCFLTRRERAEAKAELKRLIAEQVALDRALDAALKALHGAAEATGAT